MRVDSRESAITEEAMLLVVSDIKLNCRYVLPLYGVGMHAS